MSTNSLCILNFLRTRRAVDAPLETKVLQASDGHTGRGAAIGANSLINQVNSLVAEGRRAANTWAHKLLAPRPTSLRGRPAGTMEAEEGFG